jgi:hypothetical protein
MRAEREREEEFHQSDESFAFPAWADAPIAVRGSSHLPLMSLVPHADTAQQPPAGESEAADSAGDAQMSYSPQSQDHTSGSQLRRRLVTPESLADFAQNDKPGFFRRMFGRK